MFNLVRIGILVSLLAGVPAIGQNLEQSVPTKAEVSVRGFFRLAGTNGYEVRQPGLPISMTVSDAGVLEMSPLLSRSHTRVRLESYGYGAAKTLATAPTLRASNTQELVLSRPGMEEWLQNTGQGLEQFFRIASRPATAKEGKLWVTLLVSGDLTPKLIEEGRVELESEKGSEICYTGLKVWDAKNRLLDAQMDVDGSTIRISVEDKNAQYPITIDPIWGQQDRLAFGSPTPGRPPIGFGVAISGNTAVLTGGGRIRIFVRNGGIWQQQASLSMPPSSAGYSFAESVTISGDTIFTTAGKATSQSSYAGRILAFTRTDNRWKLSQTITPLDSSDEEKFSGTIDVDGNTMVIGTPSLDVNGVKGAGAVFVFSLDGDTWKQTRKISPPSVLTDGAFGSFVSVSENRIAARNNLKSAPTYIYEKSGENWVRKPNIQPTVADYLDDSFKLLSDRLLLARSLFRLENGTWVKEIDFPSFGPSTSALNTDIVAIGSPQADGPQGARTGKVTVYRYSNGSWSSEATLSASDGQSNDSFGGDIALDGDTLIVGAYGARDKENKQVGKAYAYYFGNSRMTFDKSLLRAGESTWGHIDIVTSAPEGGLTVPLSTSNTKLTAPNQVVIAAGANHVDFRVTALKSLNSIGESIITATIGDDIRKTPISIVPYVASISVPTTGNILGASTIQGTVKMMRAAPTGGFTVNLVSSNKAVIKVPSTVVVPAGSYSVDFTATVFPVGEVTDVTLSASYNTAKVSCQAQVKPTFLHLWPSGPVAQNSTGQGTITLETGRHDAFTVRLSSSSPQNVSVPVTVDIPANQSQAYFPIEVSPGATSPATLSGTYSGVTKTADQEITVQNVSSVTLGPKSIQGGTAKTISMTIYLAAPAGHGGADVSLVSSNPALASVPATAHITEGKNYFSLTINPQSVTSNQVVTISTSYGGKKPIKKTFTITP